MSQLIRSLSFLEYNTSPFTFIPLFSAFNVRAFQGAVSLNEAWPAHLPSHPSFDVSCIRLRRMKFGSAIVWKVEAELSHIVEIEPHQSDGFAYVGNYLLTGEVCVIEGMLRGTSPCQIEEAWLPYRQ